MTGSTHVAICPFCAVPVETGRNANGRPAIFHRSDPQKCPVDAFELEIVDENRAAEAWGSCVKYARLRREWASTRKPRFGTID